nr:meiotic recombination protein SPO11 [Onthophagus taurus]
MLLSQEPVVFSPKLVKQSSMMFNKEVDEVEDIHGLNEALRAINDDKTLCCDKNHYEFVVPSDVKDRNIMEKILEIYRNILIDVENNKLPAFVVVNTRIWPNVDVQDNRLMISNNPKMRTIKSMGTSAYIFDNIIWVLNKIIDLIRMNFTMTKRELYYQMKEDYNDLRMHQIDSYLSVISALVDYGPWDYHVVAATKGLVYGDLTIELSTGDIIMCDKKGGVVIPKFVDKIIKVHCNASFILVVEKDAVFQEIVNRNVSKELGFRIIVITAKGYPDMNTRLFLKKLWTITSIPAFALVDCDPYGIEIMLRYRFGSLAQVHLAHHLALPQLKWLGIFPSEIANFGLVNEKIKDIEGRKITYMLNLPYIDSNPNLKHELEILLEKGYKCNIETVLKHPSFFFNTYLPYKIRTNSFI